MNFILQETELRYITKRPSYTGAEC